MPSLIEMPRKEPEEYNCTGMTWGVFKAYAVFFV